MKISSENSFDADYCKHWYVVFTRQSSERKVTCQLKKINIEHYCPLIQVPQKNSIKRIIEYKPLFPCFVFVKMYECQIVHIKSLKGVFSMMYWLQKPALLADVEIEMIREFLGNHKNVQAKKTSVTIPYSEKDLFHYPVNSGNERLLMEGNNCRIVLPALGYVLSAESEKITAEGSKEISMPQIQPTLNEVFMLEKQSQL